MKQPKTEKKEYLGHDAGCATEANEALGYRQPCTCGFTKQSKGWEETYWKTNWLVSDGAVITGDVDWVKLKDFIATELQKVRAETLDEALEAVESKRAVWVKPKNEETKKMVGWHNAGIDDALEAIRFIKVVIK